MSISNVIKELRLKKEITQEELAKKLNITTQAVSKWENGGSPDIDMIPAIAEYFDVSIDYLFERKKIYSKDVEKVISKYLSEISDDKVKYMKIYELSFLMSVFGQKLDINTDKEKVSDLMTSDDLFYSLVVNKGGFSITSFNSNLPFNFCFPRPRNGYYDNCYKYKERHLQFLRAISQEDFYDTLVYLNKRDDTSFTEKLIERELHITIERSIDIIKTLLDFKIIEKQDLILDDNYISTYKLIKTPFIIVFLTSLELMANKPHNYYYWLNNNDVDFFKKDLEND